MKAVLKNYHVGNLVFMSTINRPFVQDALGFSVDRKPNKNARRFPKVIIFGNRRALLIVILNGVFARI